MRLSVITLFGALDLDAVGMRSEVGTEQVLAEPLLFSVGAHTVSTDTIPVVLSEVADAVGHSLWFADGKLDAVPPVGPDGIDLGNSNNKIFCTVRGHTNMRHPVKIDFESSQHILPVVAGATATIDILEPGSSGTVVTSRTIFAGKLSNNSAAEVVLSAKLLGITVRADPDGTTSITIPHEHGGLREASSVATTVLIAAYLGIIAGSAKNFDQKDRPPWTLLALDGPVCALAVIFANSGHAGNAAFAAVRNYSIVGIAAVGVVLGLWTALLSTGEQTINSNRVEISTKERRFLEPALLAALQAPFMGRAGTLTQTVAGLAVAAVAVRDLDLNIKTSSAWIEKLFAAAVVTWMSPLLINTAVMDALQTSSLSQTFPIALSVSLAVAGLVSFLSKQKVH